MLKKIDWEAIKEDYVQGNSMSFLAKKYGVSQPNISYHIKKNKLKVSSKAKSVLELSRKKTLTMFKSNEFLLKDFVGCNYNDADIKAALREIDALAIISYKIALETIIVELQQKTLALDEYAKLINLLELTRYKLAISNNLVDRGGDHTNMQINNEITLPELVIRRVDKNDKDLEE